jgi:hypothetical protein
MNSLTSIVVFRDGVAVGKAAGSESETNLSALPETESEASAP